MIWIRIIHFRDRSPAAIYALAVADVGDGELVVGPGDEVRDFMMGNRYMHAAIKHGQRMPPGELRFLIDWLRKVWATPALMGEDAVLYTDERETYRIDDRADEA
jgi:hypothetical protein